MELMADKYIQNKLDMKATHYWGKTRFYYFRNMYGLKEGKLPYHQCLYCKKRDAINSIGICPIYTGSYALRALNI